jgi:hypothetical protein
VQRKWNSSSVFFPFINLSICAYIVWAISPPCPPPVYLRCFVKSEDWGLGMWFKCSPEFRSQYCWKKRIKRVRTDTFKEQPMPKILTLTSVLWPRPFKAGFQPSIYKVPYCSCIRGFSSPQMHAGHNTKPAASDRGLCRTERKSIHDGSGVWWLQAQLPREKLRCVFYTVSQRGPLGMHSNCP